MLESRSTGYRKVKLLESHLVAGDLTEMARQGQPDALVAVRELGLQVADVPQ
jgi:hypothetical protein